MLALVGSLFTARVLGTRHVNALPMPVHCAAGRKYVKSKPARSWQSGIVSPSVSAPGVHVGGAGGTGITGITGVTGITGGLGGAARRA